MTTRNGSDEFLRAYSGWLLAALVAIGALLRLVDLGALGFRWDEDLSSLAAKAIAERGVPELPSGMIYLRSGAFLYLLAASGELFGFTEWALRLPAALFGIATIPLAFLFGKRLFGTGVGLILAALVTFSAWDIEFSRYARMYAPFEFFYLLTLLGIWRYRVVESSTSGGILCIGVALIALSLHDLGYTLALAFLVPLLLTWRESLASPRRLIFPAAAFLTVAAAFFLWQRIQGRYFDRAAIQAAEAAAAEPGGAAELAAQTAAGQAETDGGGLSGFVQGVLSQVRLPDLESLSALADLLPAAAVAFVAVPLLAAAVFLIRRRGDIDVLSAATVAVVALSCGLQLFNVALLATLALAFFKLRGIQGFRAADVRFAIALIGTAFVAWLAATLAFDLAAGADGRGGGVTAAVRQLLNYPSFFVFWGFPREYPLMSIPALIGGLWAFDRSARRTPEPGPLFLLAVFAIPVVLNGIMETRYQNFRYNVPFGPLFFAFVALGIVKWQDVLAAWREGLAPPRLLRPRPALVTALLAAAVLALDMNPLRSWVVAQQTYDDDGPLEQLLGVRDFRDYRSAASFVTANADRDDTIVAFDCREYFNYLGRLDYCILSRTYLSGDDELIQSYVDDGTLRDLYLSTPLITDVHELRRILGTDKGTTTWLLASDSMWTDSRRVDKELRHFIAELDDSVVHVASDGDTKVYRF